jgi:glycosyltransferase involved in cell wall biosynthesis
VLTLVIPVYRNEGSIPDLLDAVSGLHRDLDGQMQAVFVIDGSPDRSFELLRDALPARPFASKLALLSRNFGSFSAIRAGLELSETERYAVMAADLQEPPELVLEMDKALRTEPVDVVVGTRQGREDPLMTRLPAQLFWWLYRKYVVPEVPPGGVTPVSPPSTKMAMKPSRNSVGAFAFTFPFHSVAIHANTWIAVGTATAMLAAETKPISSVPRPAVNM